MNPLHVLVKFGTGVPVDEQGPVMLAMEVALRARGIKAEVLKATMPDDSKLRVRMTDEERGKL